MNLELVGALNELEKERGISKEILFEAIEAALVSAYKKYHGNTLNIRVDIAEKTGQIRVFARKDVVDEVLDEANEISLEEAQAIDPSYELDDIVEIEVTPKDFGRIAAQTAKQVVIQRIREAERALIYEEFSNRKDDIMTGIVQRHEHRNVIIDLGKVEAVLPPSEQVQRDNYQRGNRLKVYIADVKKTTKGPQVYVSRSHPGLLKRLFELEVPEIHDGIVEIKAIAREAGNRSKIAVYSSDRNVDPVGACVGPRGMRVQTIVDELGGEKIDIVAWDPQPDRFIANALSPSKVVRVIIDPFEKSARAVVPDHQLSLAIGKEGQNARLAARLTGWKIDIKSETQMRELIALEALQPKGALPDIFGDTSHDAEEEAVELAAPEQIEAVEEALVEAEASSASDLAEEVAAAPEVETYEEFDEVEDALESYDDLAPEFEEDDEPEDEMDVDELEMELDEDDSEIEPAPSKPKRKRAKMEESLDELMVDADDEDDPLPSLFEVDPEEAGLHEPAPVVGLKSKPMIKKPSAKKKDDKEKRDGKRVLRDLSELAKLIDNDPKE